MKNDAKRTCPKIQGSPVTPGTRQGDALGHQTTTPSNEGDCGRRSFWKDSSQHDKIDPIQKRSSLSGTELRH